METLQSHDAGVRATTKTKAKAVVFSSRYVLVRRLAEGGTSVLYLARDTFSANSFVVLKCIHANLLRSDSTRDIARSEFMVAKQLAHPNLVSIYDIRRDKGLEYLVMEYLSGDSLNNILSRSRFDYGRAVSVMDPLVDVLIYLHAQGVVHSDVKPSNIIVGKSGGIKLIDLANCRQDSHVSKPKVSIKSEHFFGYSLDYSSPQVISDQPATASDDVFSLACVLYEMLEGKSPIPAEKKTADMNLSSIKKPSAINVLQWFVLKRAMSVDATQRYSSVSVFYRRFKQARSVVKFTVGLVALVLCLLVAGFAVSSLWQSHHHEHLKYKGAYDQQQSMESLVDTIRQRPPMERYQALGQLSSLPTALRQGALLTLHDDVVFPVTAHVHDALFANASTPDYQALDASLKALSQFYPQSSALLSAQDTLAQEQKVLVDGLVLSIEDVVEGGLYNSSSAEQFNLVAQQFSDLKYLHNIHLVDVVDVGPYSQSLNKLMTEKSWLELGELYQFARDVKVAAPAFLSLWDGFDVKTVANVAAFSQYINGGDYTLASFPSDAGLSFFGAELKRLNRSISRSFYNKDINRYADQLLDLKSTYRIPSNFKPFQNTNRLLLNKIKDKIRFHNGKRQYKSAKSLSDLSLKLTN
ncbi:MAG: serine/threonine-protein kinase [Cellvibrionaceae bacterium]